MNGDGRTQQERDEQTVEIAGIVFGLALAAALVIGVVALVVSVAGIGR